MNFSVFRKKGFFPIVAVMVVLAAVVFFILHQPPQTDPQTPQADQQPGPRYKLSPLGKNPDWTKLDPYQNTMTRDEFEMSLQTWFTCSNHWQNFFKLHEDHVMIATMAADAKAWYRLGFAANEKEIKQAPRTWRLPPEMGKASESSRPLANIHIAIDAGHLGGPWAQMEERWFRIGNGMPVTEGDMTLHVARMLEPELEKLGAKVTLVRETTEPLTADRPESLMPEVLATNPNASGTFMAVKQSESLFYRTSEIRARAEKVNEQIKPDVVLCLHFNAVGWGNPADPQLVQDNHFHILLNGAYTDEELGYDDQRLDMTRRILQRTIHEEAALGGTMAKVFAEQSGLPAYPYESDSSRARNVNGNPFLWARNLLANRLYDCPVIFFEPYVMNSTEVYERVQAGDYQGIQEVAGKKQPSIYQEYTKAVIDGLVEYYKKER